MAWFVIPLLHKCPSQQQHKGTGASHRNQLGIRNVCKIFVADKKEDFDDKKIEEFLR
jgi:hypothetical protein